MVRAGALRPLYCVMQQVRAAVRRGAVGLTGLLGLLVACSDSTTVIDARLPGMADAAPEPPAPSVLAAWASAGDAAPVFEDEQIHSYELTLSAEEWADLKAHAIEEQYKPATLRVAGELVGEVGLRFKGSSGTLRRCVGGDGSLKCSKLSMKLKFDEYEPTRRFFGLKRLNFNSMFSDASQLHERLAYRLFREMGVVAPRAVHARLVVNGESLGLFSLVEAIDGRFTDDHFKGGDGNLYKEQWPDTANPETLSQRLETNEEAPDHGAMIQFRQDLVAAAPEELPAVVERYMDLDNLLAYVAVDHTIMNWDGMTAFYCRGGGCRNHNYYFYQHEQQARFSLIPWDVDNTFKVYNNFDYVPSPLQVPSDCGRRYAVFAGLSVLAPGCDPLLQGLARSDPSRYQAQLTRLLEGPFAPEELEAWLDARVAELIPVVDQDIYGPGLREFVSQVQTLRRELDLLVLRLRAERDGEQVVRSRLDSNELTDFESASSLGVKLGISAASAPDSDFEVELGTGEAVLGGQQDLVLGFEFSDAREPRSHWLRYTLPFNSPDAVDLNQKSAVRLVLQADAARTLRIGILSSNYSQAPSATSPSFGWDVALDGTRQVIELPLASASMPESGAALPDILSDVLAYGAALLIDPLVQGVNADGYLGTGVKDRGSLRVDEIQFLP
jgi:spore coat protein H